MQRVQINKKDSEDPIKPIIGAPVVIYDVDRFGDCFEITINKKDKNSNKSK